MKFLIKIENDVRSFIFVDDFGYVQLTKKQTPIDDHDLKILLNKLLKDNMKPKFNDHSCLPISQEIHQVSKVDITKPESKFDLELWSVNFESKSIDLEDAWNFHVTLKPSASVKCTSVST